MKASLAVSVRRLPALRRSSLYRVGSEPDHTVSSKIPDCFNRHVMRQHSQDAEYKCLKRNNFFTDLRVVAGKCDDRLIICCVLFAHYISFMCVVVYPPPPGKDWTDKLTYHTAAGRVIPAPSNDQRTAGNRHQGLYVYHCIVLIPFGTAPLIWVDQLHRVDEAQQYRALKVSCDARHAPDTNLQGPPYC